MAAEQIENRKIMNNYHLDCEYLRFKHCKKAAEQVSDLNYRQKISDIPSSQGMTKANDHFKHIRKFQSEWTYKQDLILAQGHVTQIHDEPWVKHHRDLQGVISKAKYADDQSVRVSNYLPDKFIKHVAKVMEKVSDVSYKQDYIEDLKGNCYPIPDRLDFKHFKKASKVISERMYKMDAKKHTATIDQNALELKQHKKAMELASNLNYKTADHAHHQLDSVGADTIAIKHASEMKDLQSKENYIRHARRDMENIKMPAEGDMTQQVQVKNSRIASNMIYKEEAMKQLERTCHLYEGKDHEHQKKVRNLRNDAAYKNEALEAYKSNKAGVTPFIAKQIEAQKMAGVDNDYRKKYEEDQANYKASHELVTRQVKEAKRQEANISNLNYKESFEETVGNCTGVPLLDAIKKQMKLQAVISDANYKQKIEQEHSNITADSKSMEPAKIAKKLCDANYRTANLKKHMYNPDNQKQKDQQELVSNINYKHQEDGHKYTVVLDTPDLIRLKKQKELLESKYRTRPAFKGIQQDSMHISADKRAQLAASEAKYKHSVEGRPAFTKMEYNPQIKHSADVAKACSDINYRSYGHKGINFETAEMRKAREAQDIASNLTYKQDRSNYTFTNEDRQIAHLRKQKELTSDLKYKEGKAGKFTASAERSDLKHLSEIKNLSSNNAYKQEAQYTFVLDTPANEHAKKAKVLWFVRGYTNLFINIPIGPIFPVPANTFPILRQRLQEK